MPVKIRLQRYGRKKRPFYHIVVADSRSPRDGKYISRLGTYNPTTKPATIELDRDQAFDWIMKGAQPTDTARAILKFKGVYYKKHLMRGVSKGALTQEQAEQKYQEWINSQETKIAARVKQTAQEVAARDARLAGSHLIADAKTKAAERFAAIAEAAEEVAKKAAEEAAKIADETILDSTKEATFISEEKLISGDISIDDDGNTADITSLDLSTIEIKIDRDFGTFTRVEQETFIQNLKSILRTQEDIEIVHKREGSVILRLKLSDENAKKILKLLSTGELDSFDILSAELLNYDKEELQNNDRKRPEKKSLNNWKSTIKEKIAKNEFQKVFSEFKSKIHQNEDVYDVVINLQARYNRSVKLERIGANNQEHSNREMNTIRSSMLGITNQLDEKQIKKKYFK